MSDLGDIQMKMAGAVGLDEGGETAVKKLHSIQVPVIKAADDAMASTATTDYYVWTNTLGYTVRVVSAKYVAANTITASDSAYATLNIKRDDGAGGAAAVAAALSTTTTDSGNVATGVPENFTVTAANALVAAGANLLFGIAKTGAGVVVRAGCITIELERV